MDNRLGVEADIVCGRSTVLVYSDSRSAGVASANRVIAEFEAAYARGYRTFVLWLMAAPSGLEFYEAFVSAASQWNERETVFRNMHVFQFDDYPIGRNDSRFPATFRHLLEQKVIDPLMDAVRVPFQYHPLELTGDSTEDREVSEAYERAMLELLDDDRVFVIEVKGTGMDGHWGFHGSETPLSSEPKLMSVSMNASNISQQMHDWPDLFPKSESVPKTAYSFTVEAFNKADFIIDITPQATKAFAVLANYLDDEVRNDLPSSAIKTHPNSLVCLTKDSAQLLLTLRERRRSDPLATLTHDELSRLDQIWLGSDDKKIMQESISHMHAVLVDLKLIHHGSHGGT